jgi:hypothetical protein
MTVALTLDQQRHRQNALRTHQSRYDEVLRQVGRRAREPVLGESELDYRREVCRDMKMAFLPQNHPLYKVNWRGLRADALGALEPDLLKAVPVEAFNPLNFEPGQLVPREVVDEYGKTKVIKWVGRESFVKAMGRPGRKVVSFMHNPALMPQR